MGWLPVVAAAASLAPRLVNALGAAPGLSKLALMAAGADPRREIPLFADETLQEWFARRGSHGTGELGEVLLWPDTFTNRFHPSVGRAAVEVLEAAGWRVTIPTEHVCCGLTWISTGQVPVAKRVLQRTVGVLRDHVRAGGLVLGLEPSCTAVFRGDAPELFPHDHDVRRLKQQTVTLAELLLDHTPGWQPPHLDRKALVQFHCHHHSIMGTEPDRKLLAKMGVDADALNSGCCGLAGNFGFEAGHYDVSMASGERVLFPALRDADEDAAILADGFSCRTQIEQGDTGGRRGMHLAELVHGAMQADPAGDGCPDEAYTERPSVSRTARYGALAGAVASTGAALYAATRLTRSSHD
jgi:Fe-S oxidoreductase